MYFVHVWKSCGMKMENVRFVWTSQFIEENATEPLGFGAESEREREHDQGPKLQPFQALTCKRGKTSLYPVMPETQRVVTMSHAFQAGNGVPNNLYTDFNPQESLKNSNSNAMRE